jgi:ribosome maturation factor RimP
MKRVPVQPAKITAEMIHQIESTVFAVADKNLDTRFYLLDVALEKEAAYWYLRVYIEGKDVAVSLNDCEEVSRALDPLLEGLFVLQNFSYSLEISSPGLFRPLKKSREFEFFKNSLVRIETHAPAVKKNAKPQILSAAEGVLQAFDEARGVVMLQVPGKSDLLEVALAENTVVYLNPELHFPNDSDDASED